MDISPYDPLIEFAEKNKQQAILLGTISECIFKGSDVSSKAVGLEDNSYLYFDASTMKFLDPLYSEYFYSVYILDQEIRNAGFNILQFIDNSNFTELKRNRQVSYHFEKLVFINASRVFNIDLAELLAKEAAISKRVNQLFFESSSYLNVASPYFLAALESSTKGIKPEDNYIALNFDLRRIGKLYPQIAETIISTFRANPEKSILFFPHLFWGMIEGGGFKHYFNILEELLFDPIQNTRIAAIRSISMLHGNQNHLDGLEDRIEAAYLKIIDEENVSLIAEVLNSFGILIKYLPSSEKMILEIPTKCNESRILFTLSHLLWMHSDTLYDQSWFVTSLNRLSTFENTHLGIFDNLNMVFIGLEKNNPDRIYDYLDAYITNEANDPTAIEGFKNTIIGLAIKNKELLESVLTDWFNNDNLRFHAAAATVCSMLWINDIKELQLNKEKLDGFSWYDIEFMLLKIVGYVSSKEHLQSLLFSSLKKASISTEHFKLVFELFVSYLAYNYLGSLEYLEEKSSNATPIELKLITEVRLAIDKYYQNRLSKPKELTPSVERLNILFEQRNKSFQEQNLRGRYPEPSIVDMVQKVSIKNGHYYFSRSEKTYGPNQYSPKSSMQKIELRMEMPSAEFIDPVAQAYNRTLWRMFKRRGK